MVYILDRDLHRGRADANWRDRGKERRRALERKCGEQQTIIAAYERAFEKLGARLTTEARAGADQLPETNEASEAASTREGEQA